jgi:hypothetical protein
MRKRGQGFEDPRVRVIKAMYDANTIFVILSGTKDLFQGEDEILRCAQNDKAKGSEWQMQFICHPERSEGSRCAQNDICLVAQNDNKEKEVNKNHTGNALSIKRKEEL